MRLLFLLSLSLLLQAHDMWIEPTTFSPKPGEIVGVKLRVGQDLLGDPIPRDAALIREFAVDDGTGRKPLVGREGADPAGYLRVPAPGMQVVVYNSNPSRAELTAEKFAQYVKEEGLEQIAAGATGPTRDMFTRCAKSLILSGPAAATADRTVGLTLELTAERNPYALRDGEPLPLRLTYRDKPLQGALVVAISRKYPSARVSARTGADGRVRLNLRPDGLWLVKAVHMVRSTTPDADWMSYWASLTFELGARK